jgi:hypothetical protein
MSDFLSVIPKIIFGIWDFLKKRSQSKQSQDPIEKAHFTKHFFEEIDGKTVHPMTLERNIQTLLSNNKINAAEASFFLQAWRIDGQFVDIEEYVIRYTTSKKYLKFDVNRDLEEQVQFKDHLLDDKARSRYRWQKFAGFISFVLIAFLSLFILDLIIGYTENQSTYDYYAQSLTTRNANTPNDVMGLFFFGLWFFVCIWLAVEKLNDGGNLGVAEALMKRIHDIFNRKD